MTVSSGDLFFEDFSAGARFETGGVSITESMIVEFALLYDPQPMHMDGVAAKKGGFGGLIAPGVLTLSLTARLIVDLGLFRACNLGSTGIDELRWMKPVRPDDRLNVQIEVTDTRPSTSKPDRGVLHLLVKTLNDHGDIVMSYRNVTLVRRRLTTGAGQ